VSARRFTVLTACAAAISLASPQSGRATDLPLRAPQRARLPAPAARAAPIDWNGPYFGGELGFDAAAAKYVRPPVFGNNQSDISIGSVNRGLVGGLYAGFNYEFESRLVVGVEADLISSRAGYRELGPDIDFLQASKYVVAVVGRAGVVIMPTTMVYAKGGPAWINVRGVEGFGSAFDKTLEGELIGAGIESLVAPSFTVRLEGSYARANETLLLNQGFDQYRPAILQVMLGGAYKLDMPGLGAPASTPATGPLYTKAPAAVAAVHWTGIEVGAFASANEDQMRFLGPGLGEKNEQGPYANLAIGGGGFLGLNVELYPHLVAGAEVSANFQKSDFNTANGVGLGGRIVHFASISEIYALSLRFGWLATQSTLFYLKTGPAWIRVSPDPDFWNAIAPGSVTNPVTVDGYQYGGGAETYLTPNLSVRVEGIYTASSDTPQQLTFLGVQPTPFKLKPSLLTGTLGAAAHF
jgi:outer membrane immunogenic protein